METAIAARIEKLPWASGLPGPLLQEPSWSYTTDASVIPIDRGALS